MTKIIKERINRAAKAGIDRRSFMAGAAAIGMSAGIGLGPAIKSAEAATPKKGGTFRVGLAGGAVSDTLNPALFDNEAHIFINYTLRNNLAELTSEDELVGELAESWEATPEAAIWTFELRRGVEFHNGKSFEAEDVIATLNHHRGEESKSGAKSLFAAIEEIKADGKNRVIVKLSSGNADFPALLTDFHMGICPADGAGGIDWASGVGTGSYALSSFDPGIRLHGIRNPNFWKEGKANFDDVEMLVILDNTARTNALISGEIDANSRCDLKTLHFLEQAENITIDETASAAHPTMAMDTRAAPFDNNDVRLALKYALDREEILQKIKRGHGTLGNDHPISPGMRYFNADIPQRVYDPDKARFHLKQAGLDKLKVKIHAADAPFLGAIDASVLFREHAVKAGIDIEVVREPNDGFWTDVWQKKPFVTSNWGARATADMIFTTVYYGDAPWNETFWRNDRFDKLLLQARTELDEAHRAELYGEMQLIVRDEGGAIVPFFHNYVYARANRVQHGPSLGTTWALDGHKSAERWWFA